MRLAGAIVVACLGLATRAFAAPPVCTQAESVWIHAAPGGFDARLDEVARQLAAGLAPAGVAVCTGHVAGDKAIARVELESDRPSHSALRIVIDDALTHKTLAREVDLRSIPTDSRAVAVALYIEELLQASWVELSLSNRAYLREHPRATPRAVHRILDRVLRVPAQTPERRLRVSLGGDVASYTGGVRQIGAQLSLGFGAVSWLELSLRVALRGSPDARTALGAIQTQSLGAGIFLDPFLRIDDAISMRFPQGLDVARVFFSGDPVSTAQHTNEARTAVVVSHGAGVRYALGPVFSATLIARFCWVWLDARAGYDRQIKTGISGVGGEAELTLDAYF